MRNYLYFIFIVFVISCKSSGNSETTVAPSNTLSPPAWVRGSWSYKNQVILFNTTLSNDDAIISTNGVKLSLKGYPSMSYGGNNFTISEPTKTGSVYEIMVKNNGVELAFYRWASINSQVNFYQRAGVYITENLLTKD